MTVEDLIIRLRLEEDNKAIEKGSHGNLVIFEADIVENDPTNSKKRKKIFEQQSNLTTKKFKEN